MDFKSKILDALEKLRQKEVANKQPFKVRAYATVIKNLKASDKPINNLDDIKDIKGIGKSIHDKIEEILDTGNLKQLEKYDAHIKAINELTKVHGIGPVKAKELVEEHGIVNLEDLKEHKELLNDKQLMGLKYAEDFVKRIPKLEMSKHDAFIQETIKKIDPKLTAQVVGSYRRGAKDSGDIDVIITHADDPTNYDNIIKSLVADFKKHGYLKDDFALGTHKYLGVCKLKYHKSFRRIDFLYATRHVWPFSVMYFTGSSDFNIWLRRIALHKGLSMSEYGFKKVGKDELLTLPIYTEDDIFKYLGVQYIPPEKRTGNEKELEKYII